MKLDGYQIVESVLNEKFPIGKKTAIGRVVRNVKAAAEKQLRKPQSTKSFKANQTISKITKPARYALRRGVGKRKPSLGYKGWGGKKAA